MDAWCNFISTYFDQTSWCNFLNNFQSSCTMIACDKFSIFRGGSRHMTGALWSSCFHFNCMVINVNNFPFKHFVLFAIIHAPQFLDVYCLFKSNLQLFTVNITQNVAASEPRRRWRRVVWDVMPLISGINWKIHKTNIW